MIKHKFIWYFLVSAIASIQMSNTQAMLEFTVTPITDDITQQLQVNVDNAIEKTQKIIEKFDQTCALVLAQLKAREEAIKFFCDCKLKEIDAQ